MSDSFSVYGEVEVQTIPAYTADMQRRRFIGANIKMHALPTELRAYQKTDTVDVVIFPAACDLQKCVEAGLTVGVQTARPDDQGAFTGDLSMTMVKERGVTHVLCGHSERRMHHHESDTFVAEQVKKALELGLIPVLCIGETGDEREMGKTNEVLQRQLEFATRQPLPANRTVVAYEPVWAIGTGLTPTIDEIQETHAFIRSLLPDKDIQILYGGSVKAANAKEIFGCRDVDGALVGGASLDPVEFRKIVEAA